MLVALLVFVLLLGMPLSAHAWGAVTHLRLGCGVLDQLSLLPPLLQELLRHHPLDFLYGNLSADTILWKNLAPDYLHCHKWENGVRVLRSARSGPERSFAWGYLSHLASDTVSHNYFVPKQLIKSYRKRRHSHAYWEMRLDNRAPGDVWSLLKRLGDDPEVQHDDLLEDALAAPPLLNFRWNKRIFNGFLVSQRMQRWRRMVERVGAQVEGRLGRAEEEEYVGFAQSAILDFLVHFRGSAPMRIDPTGRELLGKATQLRRRLRRMARRDVREAQVLQGAALRALSSPAHYPGLFAAPRTTGSPAPPGVLPADLDHLV